MKQSAYYGHESQLFGVEEYRLVGGKGDGMRLLNVRNGKGLEFTVSADRCADITKLFFRGENYGFSRSTAMWHPHTTMTRGTAGRRVSRPAS